MHHCIVCELFTPPDRSSSAVSLPCSPAPCRNACREIVGGKSPLPLPLPSPSVPAGAELSDPGPNLLCDPATALVVAVAGAFVDWEVNGVLDEKLERAPGL